MDDEARYTVGLDTLYATIGRLYMEREMLLKEVRQRDQVDQQRAAQVAQAQAAEDTGPEAPPPRPLRRGKRAV